MEAKRERGREIIFFACNLFSRGVWPIWRLACGAPLLAEAEKDRERERELVCLAQMVFSGVVWPATAC